MDARGWTLASLMATLIAGCGGDPESGFASLQAELSVSPQALDPTIFGGTTFVGTITIENTGTAPATIDHVTLEDQSGPAMGSVSAEHQMIAQDSAIEVEVRITALEAQTGLYLSHVVIELAGGARLDVPVAAPIRPRPGCDDGNPCTLDGFVDGACVNEMLPNGSSCDDDNVCTLSSMCSEGACVGEVIDCDDGVECTADTCDPELGCASEPVDALCADDDPCSDDVCNPEVGCMNPTSPEGTICSQDGCAEVGFCIQGQCQTSVPPEDFPCDDGNPCTTGDSCQEGLCVGEEGSGLGNPEPLALYQTTGGIELSADLCLGSDDFCEGVPVPAVPAKVLAAYSQGAVVAVVWQTDFFMTTTGETCTPDSEQAAADTELRFGVDGNEPVVGDEPVPGGQQPEGEQEGHPADKNSENNDGALDEEPEPNQGRIFIPDLCAAGIFLTTYDPNGPPNPPPTTTMQLGSTRGVSAAAFGNFELDEPASFDVAIVAQSQSVLYRRWSAGVVTDEQSWWPELGGVLARRAALTLGPGQEAAVVLTPAVRQSSRCPRAPAEGACDSTFEVRLLHQDPGVGTFTPTLPESYEDDWCPQGGYGPYGLPFDARDLSVELYNAGQVEFAYGVIVTMLAEPLGCLDPAYASDVRRDLFQFRRTGDGTLIEGQSIAAPGNGGRLFRLHRGEYPILFDQPQVPFVDVGWPATGIIETMDCNADGLPAPEPPGDGFFCEPSALDVSVQGAGWSVTRDYAAVPFALGPIDALPMSFEGQPRTLVRRGQILQMRWWEFQNALPGETLHTEDVSLPNTWMLRSDSDLVSSGGATLAIAERTDTDAPIDAVLALHHQCQQLVLQP